MLQTARIMRRRSSEVNGGTSMNREATGRRSRSRIFLLVACLIVSLASCDSRERKAERLAREAKDLVTRGEHAEAAKKLETLYRDFPESPLAEGARRDAVLYRGLDDAVRQYPLRRAREILVQVARSVERYRADARAAPSSLDDLVPRYLDAVPEDPWGRALVYTVGPGARRYRLSCLGADGAPGGEGDDVDLVVADGAFVAEGS